MRTFTTVILVLLLFSCATTPALIHPEDYLLALNTVMQFPNFISNEKYTTCEFTTNISKQTFQFKYKDNGLLEHITINRIFTQKETNSPYTVDLFWDDSRRLVKTETKTMVNKKEYFLIVEFFYTDRNSYTLDHVTENNETDIKYKKILYQENKISKIEWFLISKPHDKPADTKAPYQITSMEYRDGAISKIIQQETAAAELHSVQSFKYDRNQDKKIIGFSATQQFYDIINKEKYIPVTYTAVFN